MKFKMLTLVTIAAILPTAVMSDGAAIYNKTCSVCHAAGVAGAPKLGDKAAWAPRISQGVDAMVSTVSTGKGAMPPKGTCMDCSDADLKSAVEYMISQSQ